MDYRDIPRPMSHIGDLTFSRCGEHGIQYPSGASCPACSPGPEEKAPSGRIPLDPPILPTPRGSHIPHEIRRELLDCIVDSVRNLVWILNNSSDRRGSADDLELVSAEIHDASEDDRRIAKLEKVEVVSTRIERARQELRGAYSTLSDIRSDLQVSSTNTALSDTVEVVQTQLASALALLEEVGR